MNEENFVLLKDLIGCKPVSENVDNVNRALGLMRTHLEKHGVICAEEQMGARKILYASTLPGKRQSVLLNAHLDVVPAPDEMFVPQEDNGCLYARGASDCLGNAVAVAEVLCRLVGKYSVSAIFTTDEEIGGETTREMVARGYGAEKLVILLDAAAYSITYAQKGIMVVTLRAKGRGGHSSVPWTLDNPIDRLVNAYTALRSDWENLPSDCWGNTMTPCIIRGGSAHNQVPDSAEMVLNIRYINPDDPERILARLKGVSDQIEVIVNMTSEPVAVQEDNPLLQQLHEVMNKAFPGHSIHLSRMHGATDARHFVKLNVPIAILGVEGSGCHSNCEWVNLENIDEYTSMLCDFISSL